MDRGWSTILGIALCVDDVQRGPKLAFRYPPLMVSSHSSPLSWSSVTGSTSPLKTDESRTPDTPSSTANQQPTAGNGGAHTPASVSANSSPSTSPAGIQNSSGSSDGNTDDHQLAHMVVRSGDQFANMFRPKNALCTGEILELRVDDIMFISCPILLQTKEKATKEYESSHKGLEKENSHQSDSTDSSKRGGGQAAESHLSMFNLIVVCHNSFDEDKPKESCSRKHRFEKDWVESVIHRFSNALSLQEKVSSYVSQQARILTELREKWLHEAKGTDVDDLLRDSLEQSTLATELIQLFYTLHFHRSDLISLRQSSSISIPPPNQSVLSHFPSEGIRSYHTILLFHGVRETETLLPIDCNDTLRNLVREASPFIGIPVIQARLGVSRDMLSTMIEHLVKWGLARLTTVLSEDSVLRVTDSNSAFEEWVSQYDDISTRFKRRFKNQELGGFLALFDGKKRMQELTSAFDNPEQCSEFLSMVAWAMSHGLIEQVKSFLQFVPPDSLVVSKGEDQGSWKATGKIILEAINEKSPRSDREEIILSLRRYVETLLEQKLTAEHTAPRRKEDFISLLAGKLIDCLYLMDGRTPIEYICQTYRLPGDDVEALCMLLPEILVKLEYGEHDSSALQ